MRIFWIAATLVCLLAGWAKSACSEEGVFAPMRVVESSEEMLISEGEQKVLFYQREAKSRDGRYERSHYVHPLYGLDGRVLTEDFPEDHLHHRGVFWAWHQVTVNGTSAGDSWALRDFSWDVRDVGVEDIDDNAATIKSSVFWKSPRWADEPGREKPFVVETVRIRVHRLAEGVRKIDFEIALKALEEDVRIGGSEDDKGYGGFSVRVKLPEDVVFTGKSGEVTPRRTALPPGPWMDISGSLTHPGETSGVTILVHPSTPGFPQPWILRERRSMQNPVFPGRETVRLPADKPLVLRYRLVLHEGGPQPEAMQRWQAEYAEAGAE